MPARLQVPAEIVERLRALCRALPETREEQAWVGTRWTVRGANFAHVLMIDGGWPAAYAKAAGSDGPLCVLTFRSAIAALDPLNYAEAPYFRPVWFRDIVGMRIDDATDWAEVESLVRGSYRDLAPAKLVERMEPPRAAP